MTFDQRLRMAIIHEGFAALIASENHLISAAGPDDKDPRQQNL